MFSTPMPTLPPSEPGLTCPLCADTLASWSRGTLVVEFCDGCEALFLDRGELYRVVRAEGMRCPPEALLRAAFRRGSGEALHCPKCRKDSLVPGSVEGCDLWHCTPCNGFLVERDHLLGMDVDDATLELGGFRRIGAQAESAGPSATSLTGMLRSLAFWSGPGA